MNLTVSNVSVIIVAAVMVVHFLVGIVESDLCLELDRPDGLLAIIREQAGNGIEGLGLLAVDALPDVLNKMCSQFSQLCNTEGQTACGSGCEPETIETLVASTTIFDNGTFLTIDNCTKSCSTPELQELARNITRTKEDLINLLSLIDDITVLLTGIISGETISNFVRIFCQTMGNALTLIYVGCGMLGLSIIASIILLMYLSW